MRIGYGYDVHRIGKGHKLVLGGTEIESEFGLLGHSDADVVLHAVIDAILGALAAGDIGQHFPDTDSQYKNIDSRILLQKTVDIMDKAEMEISNIDITITAEKPKLQPYLEDMRKTLRQYLHTSMKNISVKATTEEGLGVSGEGEGIAATAVVLLKSL
ncbi:MAG: 2-C-methyl-D-erythritol 2,4-cyclodiphosphate synthase [Candidatus Cloacimonadota bacterium]|nr:2-C-methyl-D-erythritol 2,4-cyclodiphosphate synthase [Candidatus Cloacimonadota bacterium]